MVYFFPTTAAQLRPAGRNRLTPILSNSHSSRSFVGHIRARGIVFQLLSLDPAA
jgi:hypothetical protein